MNVLESYQERLQIQRFGTWDSGGFYERRICALIPHLHPKGPSSELDDL